MRQLDPVGYKIAEEHGYCEHYACPRQKMIWAEVEYEYRLWEQSNMNAEESIAWAESIDKEVLKKIRLRATRVNASGEKKIINPKLYFQSSPKITRLIKKVQEELLTKR